MGNSQLLQSSAFVPGIHELSMPKPGFSLLFLCIFILLEICLVFHLSALLVRSSLRLRNKTLLDRDHQLGFHSDVSQQSIRIATTVSMQLSLLGANSARKKVQFFYCFSSQFFYLVFFYCSDNFWDQISIRTPGDSLYFLLHIFTFLFLFCFRCLWEFLKPFSFIAAFNKHI